MGARNDKKKRKEDVGREHENARRNRAEKKARAAEAARRAQQLEIQRMQKSLADERAIQAAAKRYTEMTHQEPKHKQPLITMMTPPPLGQTTKQKATRAPELIGLAYYLTALAAAANNSQFIGNSIVAADIDAIVSRVPRNQYAYISFERIGSISYSSPASPDDGTFQSLPIHDPNSVHVNRVPPLIDTRRGVVFAIQGTAPPEVKFGPEPPTDPLGWWNDLKQQLHETNRDKINGLDPISEERRLAIEKDLDERRKERERQRQSEEPAKPPEEKAELPPQAVEEGSAAPHPDQPPALIPQPQPAPAPSPQPAPAPDPQPEVRSMRVLGEPEAAGAAPPSFRRIIDEVLAHGRHPPPPPPHPESGLPSVARALSQVEAKLRKAAHGDEEIRSAGLQEVAKLLASADPEMRPRLRHGDWLVDEDAYVDMLCSGHWRTFGETAQLGDVAWMAEPAIPGGLRVGIALAEKAGSWLTMDSNGSFRIASRAAGSEVLAAWQPLPRDVFNPAGPIGSVWTPKRWRALLADCYASAAATVDELVGPVARATGLRGAADPLSVSERVLGELHNVALGPPLWPGAVVFGREAGDFGVLLPDGRVLGTSAANRYAESVTSMRLQRFQPRFVWYPRALG